MTTTISGDFTANGSSSILSIGRQPENVTFDLLGPSEGRYLFHRSVTRNPAGAWETLASYADQAAAVHRVFPSDGNQLFKIEARGLDDKVTNGAFAADTDWTAGVGWTIATGVATRTASASTPNLDQTLATGLIEGASYTVTFDITTSAGSLTVSLGGGTASTAISDADATVSVTLVAGATAVLQFAAGATYAGTLDNITVIPQASYTLADENAVDLNRKDLDDRVLQQSTQETENFPNGITGNVIGNVTGAVTGAVNDVPVAELQTVDPSQKFTLFEDFYGTWAIGDAGPADTWSTTAGSGTANAVAVTVAGSVNGEVTLKSASDDGTVAANCSTFTGINASFKANQGGLVMEARLKIDDISEAVMFVGFTDTISTTVELPIFLATTNIDSDAANACGVGYDVDGTTKQFFHGGVKADTDTVPAYSGTAPVDATYFIVRVEVSAAGAVTGYINGVAIGAAVAAAVTITTALTPCIVIGNRSANQVIATIDYVWAQQNR